VWHLYLYLAVVQAVVKREPLLEWKYQRGWGTAEPHELNPVMMLKPECDRKGDIDDDNTSFATPNCEGSTSL